MGPRKRSEQARFKDDLIQSYSAVTVRPNKLKVIIPVYNTTTGCKLLKLQVTAAYLFPYKLSLDVLVSFFNEDVEGELITVCITRPSYILLTNFSLLTPAIKWSATSI